MRTIFGSLFRKAFFLIRCIAGLLLWSHACHAAQYPAAKAVADTVLALPKDQQFQKLWLLLYPPATEDTLQSVRFYKEVQDEFIKRGEDWLAMQAWGAEVECMIMYVHLYHPRAIPYIAHYTEVARKRGWKVSEAECTIRQGIVYYRQLKWGPAFEYLQKGYQKLKAAGIEQSPRAIPFLQEIAQCYYEFGDYEGAIQFLREAITIQPKWVKQGDRYISKNTLALAFQRTDQLDSANYYFQSAHQEALAKHDDFWAALTNGNVGNILYLRGAYDEAIPLLHTDFEESQKIKEWQSAVNASMLLATIHLQKGETDKAKYYLDFGLKNINYGSIRDLSGFYKNLATISRIRQDFDRAFAYMDSARVYEEKLRKINDARVIQQAKLKLEVEHHAHEIRLLEATRSRQLLLRNGLLIMLVLSGIIAGLWINRQRIQVKKEQELASLRQAKTEDELQNAKRELMAFTHMLREKNELIESFRNELDHLHDSDDQRVIERSDQLNRLLTATILTDEDWREFRILFDKVHPGFFIRLKEKMADLSPADTRLLALTKLQLSPKEMASMLGLTYEAIKKSRQRLRKKINLPEEGTLDELVNMI